MRSLENGEISSRSTTPLLLILLLVLGGSVGFSEKLQAQPDFGEFQRVLSGDSTYADFNYILVIHSSHFCGYCRKLRADFHDRETGGDLKIVFIEYDTPVEKILAAETTYKNSDVHVPGESHSRRIDFFPTSYLYDLKKNKKRKIKGYTAGFWGKVLRKT